MLFLFVFLILQVFTCKVLTAPTESQTNPVGVNDVAFIKLGTYRGFTDGDTEYQKSYFLSRYSSSLWAESHAICNAYNLELASMETLQEARVFLSMTENDTNIKSLTAVWLWIDAITLVEKSTNDWYWTKSGKKISFSLDWIDGNPSGNGQFCLVVGKANINTKFAFNDGNCGSSFKFVCQRIDYSHSCRKSIKKKSQFSIED
ncbi:hypothetical protein ACKWTF_008871 [Chironomus riparius]